MEGSDLKTAPYDIWERQGFIMTTEGNVIHYGFVHFILLCIPEWVCAYAHFYHGNGA